MNLKEQIDKLAKDISISETKDAPLAIYSATSLKWWIEDGIKKAAPQLLAIGAEMGREEIENPKKSDRREIPFVYKYTHPTDIGKELE